MRASSSQQSMRRARSMSISDLWKMALLALDRRMWVIAAASMACRTLPAKRLERQRAGLEPFHIRARRVALDDVAKHIEQHVSEPARGVAVILGVAGHDAEQQAFGECMRSQHARLVKAQCVIVDVMSTADEVELRVALRIGRFGVVKCGYIGFPCAPWRG